MSDVHDSGFWTGDYEDVRDHMQPGDLIAFGGKGTFSELIKSVTRSAVSHVGVIRHTMMLDDVARNVVGVTTEKELAPGTRPAYFDELRYFNEIVESTKTQGIDGEAGVIGVQAHRLSTRLAMYNGEVWWLPLSPTVRHRFDERAFFDFLYAQEGKPYDIGQAIQSGLDALDAVPFSPTLASEDLSKWFCSELVVAAYEAADVLPSVNSSEVTPIDLCSFAIYAEGYTQIKTEPEEIDVEIRGWNTLPLDVVACRFEKGAA
jgi:hypothetical protein